MDMRKTGVTPLEQRLGATRAGKRRALVAELQTLVDVDLCGRATNAGMPAEAIIRMLASQDSSLRQNMIATVADAELCPAKLQPNDKKEGKEEEEEEGQQQEQEPKKTHLEKEEHKQEQ